jgi:uncharacterized lipoprotein YajG
MRKLKDNPRLAMRTALLLPLALLAACQSAPSSREAAVPAPTPTFNQNTVQTYDLQTGEFQQAPPFGARSDRAE